MRIAVLMFIAIFAFAREYSTAYIPIYKELATNKMQFDVSVMVRNLDARNKLHIHSIRTYDDMGKEVVSFLKKDYLLNPLATVSFDIKKNADSVIVRYSSNKGSNAPLMESIMIGKYGKNSGIAFKSRARKIK